MTDNQEYIVKNFNYLLDTFFEYGGQLSIKDNNYIIYKSKYGKKLIMYANKVDLGKYFIILSYYENKLLQIKKYNANAYETFPYKMLEGIIKKLNDPKDFVEKFIKGE